MKTYVRSRPLSLLAGLLFLALPSEPSVAQTTTVTICDEVETTILHPATYVQEKVRRKGLTCLLVPHCCTPAWVLSPDCYVWKWVRGEDAWEEIVRTFSCEDYSLTPEEAFNKWLHNLFDPVPGTNVIPEDLTNIFGLYVSAAYDAASPLPDDIKGELNYLVSTGARFPFTTRNINDARWLSSGHPLAQRIWPGADSGQQGITYYNLIIVSDMFLRLPPCSQTSWWAHELVHVHQYNELGWENYLQDYLTEGLKGYENSRFEVEAFAVEGIALSTCLLRQLSLRTLTPREQAAHQRYMTLSNELRSIYEDDATCDAGESPESSERVKDRLRTLIPNFAPGKKVPPPSAIVLRKPEKEKTEPVPPTPEKKEKKK